MIKQYRILWLLLAGCLSSVNVAMAQMERINQTIGRAEAESHLRFLASDELRGRNTGTPELNIAARYIAEQFRKSDLIPLGDQEGDYLQQVPLYRTNAPSQVTAKLFGQTFQRGEELALINGENGNFEGPLVYLPDISKYEEYDLENKIVMRVIRNLTSELTNQDRVKWLKEAGAIGLIELYGPGQPYPWPLVARFLQRERVMLGDVEETLFPHVILGDTASVLVQKWKDVTLPEAAIAIRDYHKTPLRTFNVAGKIEGTDPELKKEHVILCAHYDHLGVQPGEGQDSIYNGTRDNGIGTTGVINAAAYFGRFPPRRSVILLALTGEEKGLLGSQYYVDHPKIPLEESVFALNIDNSGYTTTDVITLLDTARTNIDPLVFQAASEVGLGVIGDRFPGQNYYERSDQVSFAKKGVPAVNFKMSMTAYDERVTDFYHQPSDEVQNVELDYIYKYWRAYIRAAELIANWDQHPYWLKGDKFEPAGNKLYEK